MNLERKALTLSGPVIPPGKTYARVGGHAGLSDNPGEFKKPVTRYAKCDNLNIAYQVFGKGPIDLVYIPGWVSNIDWMWKCPELVHFFDELGKIARVILFDKRGTGLSDRVMEPSALEERMDDIRAVMDAASVQKAILFGHSEGGCVSALFAATYPNRVISLITFGIFAKRIYSPDYPWAPTCEERQKVYDMIERHWVSGDMSLEILAPSKADDRKFMNWLANYFRFGASPCAAMMLAKMNTQVDIINILPSINVPTLVMQRTHDVDVKIEEGRFIADRIKDAEFVALDGNDHLFWVGDTEEILSRMKAFVADQRPSIAYEKQLLSIVVARIIPVDDRDRNLTELINNVIKPYDGRLMRNDHFTLIVAFEGPSRALHCSKDLMQAMNEVNVKLAIGIHIAEVAINNAYMLCDEIKNFVKHILDQHKLGQILITQTVKFLLSCADFEYTEEPVKFETISGDEIPLFSTKQSCANHYVQQNLSQPDESFFENLLQCINDHLGGQMFNLDTICKSLGISERQLQRRVKTITNKTPNQLISSIRMSKAVELLQAGVHNISEVAFQVGFSSPSYFAKRFKQAYGISPSEFIVEDGSDHFAVRHNDPEYAGESNSGSK